MSLYSDDEEENSPKTFHEPTSPISLQTVGAYGKDALLNAHYKGMLINGNNSTGDENAFLLQSGKTENIPRNLLRSNDRQQLSYEDIEKNFIDEEAAHNFTMVVVTAVVVCFLVPCFAFIPFFYMCKYKSSLSETGTLKNCNNIYYLLKFLFTF